MSSVSLPDLLLRPPRLRLAVAESLTCGRVQAHIGALSGASRFFLGGLTTYTLDEKVRLLGVDEAHARGVNCVSERVAGEMALGACRLFAAEIAAATTGYAEPDPSVGVAHPFAHWAVAFCETPGQPTVVSQGRIDRPGLTRVAMQEAVAAEAIAALTAFLKTRRSA